MPETTLGVLRRPSQCWRVFGGRKTCVKGLVKMTEEQVWRVFMSVALALFGAVWGSFVNCAVSRHSSGKSLSEALNGRSKCDSCGRTLGAVDLVPIFSYLFLRGKCRKCGAKIPSDCLWTESAGVVVLGGVGYWFGPQLSSVLWLLLAIMLFTLSVIDAYERIIPDVLIVLLVVNRIVWWLALGADTGVAIDAVIALSIPAGLLVLVLVMEKLFEREAMGGGDIKLLFALAFYLDWWRLLFGLILSCVIGIVWSYIAGKKTGVAVPFGPFISVGALLSAMFGEIVFVAYMSLF